MKKLYSIFAFITLLIIYSCENNSENSSNLISTNTMAKDTINGTYTYSNNYVLNEITISGSSWYGKTMVVTGFGSSYDKNANYDNGTVKGNNLYESSGMIKIGYVSGKSLITSIGKKRITLVKNTL